MLKGRCISPFTYQGQLKDSGGNPISDSCDFRFILYDAEVGGAQVGPIQEKTAVAVAGGHFMVLLDFGSGAFTGEARWLGVEVKCSGDADYSTLNPRQALTPAPYASYAPAAGTADTANSATTAGYADTAGSADSALDADLLDGQHGSYFLNATNVNAGTLGTAYYSAYSDLSSEGYLDLSAGGDLLTRDQGDARYAATAHTHWGQSWSGSGSRAAAPPTGYTAHPAPPPGTGYTGMPRPPAELPSASTADPTPVYTVGGYMAWLQACPGPMSV